MKTIKITYIIILLTGLLIVPACTDLEEEILDEFTEDIVTSDPNLLSSLIGPSLAQIRMLWLREDVWGIQETTTDECFFPTRGTDWYDGGVWQEQYLHTWDPMHRDITATWNTLSKGISRSNTSIFNLGTPQPDDPIEIKEYRAQAIFLRAFFEYYLLDIYGIVPIRDPYNTDFSIQADILNRKQGFNHIIKELTGILNDIVLRDNAEYGVPNKDAALMLLAKMYLNKGVYVGTESYDSCLIYLNEIINPGNYGLANDYFDMFSVENQVRYKQADDEAILVAVLDDGDNYDLDDRIQWVKTTFHYNQTLGGNFTANWNGACATQGYIENVWFAGTDTATDVRWQDDRFYNSMAVMLGFNIGQQYGIDKDTDTLTALETRGDDPLIYTVECPLDDAAENEGLRILKYPPREDPINNARTPNDYIIWRYADALLMKAECIARQGNITDALTIVNEIRAKRKAPTINASTQEEMLDKILIERGLELYWEGHRRQDLIRFDKFLEPKSNKDYISPETALLCPIPQDAIQGSKGKIKQNPGY